VRRNPLFNLLCVLITVDSLYLSEMMSQLTSIDDVSQLLMHCSASIFYTSWWLCFFAFASVYLYYG